MMDSRSSLFDLANAPPLLNDSEMEVSMTGEKRKATPPDLLTLSHMYFEKNQVRNYNSSGGKKFWSNNIKQIDLNDEPWTIF